MTNHETYNILLIAWAQSGSLSMRRAISSALNQLEDMLGLWVS